MTVGEFAAFGAVLGLFAWVLVAGNRAYRGRWRRFRRLRAEARGMEPAARRRARRAAWDVLREL